MKKRITSIMDTRKKRVGALLTSLIFISALIVGGVAVQAQSYGDYDYDYDYDYESINPELDDVEQLLAAHPFEPLGAFGLSFDSTNGLVFNGEVVRYFEDAKHLPCGQVHTLTYFNPNGTAYFFAVREGYDNFPLDWSSPTPTLRGIARFTQEQIEAKNLSNIDINWLGIDSDTFGWVWVLERDRRRTEVKSEVYGEPESEGEVYGESEPESEETLSSDAPNGASDNVASVDLFATGPIAAGQGWFLLSTMSDGGSYYYPEYLDIAWFEAWLEIYGDQIRADILNGIVTTAENQTLFDCDSLYQVYALHDEAVRDGIVSTSLIESGFWFIVLNEVSENWAVISLYGINIMFQVTIIL